MPEKEVHKKIAVKPKTRGVRGEQVKGWSPDGSIRIGLKENAVRRGQIEGKKELREGQAFIRELPWDADPTTITVSGHKRKGSKLRIQEFMENKISVVDAIEEGLTYDNFKTIVENAPFPIQFWADTLGLSTKSLNRYKKEGKKFKPLQSEKILEVAEVYSLGQSVFNDDEKLTLWLNTPNFALGGKKPIDLIKTSYGKEMVLTSLTNIDNGIFI